MRRSTAALMAAAALLLLLYISMAAYVESARRQKQEVETRRMFRDWMVKVNKTYDPIGEQEHRYAVFKENLRRFRFDTSAGRLPNGLADLTEEELTTMTSGSVIPTKEELRSLSLHLIGPVHWISEGQGTEAVSFPGTLPRNTLASSVDKTTAK